MRKLFPALLLFAFSFPGLSQKPPIKFGDVSLEQVKMTSYADDPSAAAVVLVDYGTSSIEYVQSEGWFRLNFERITRIKILTTEGYSHADFEVPLYHSSSSKEKLIGLKVVTYNLENNKIVEAKIKSDAIFEEKYDQNIDLVKFTAPNVKEGSVIDVTYKISSDFLHFFRDWEFQSTIPVVWSEYRAAYPEYFNYERFMQGYIPLSTNETKEYPKSIIITSKERSTGRMGTTSTSFQTDKIDYREKMFRWVAENVAAFRDEPFMTTHRDYISKINFELAYYKFPNQPIKPVMGTWQDLTNSLLESDAFGGVVKGSGFLKKITDEVTTGVGTETEKIAAIFNYVRSNIEWNGVSRKYVSGASLKDALDTKKGSSAQINLMLTSMLQKAGFRAHPVILSTRSHGFVRENFALSSQFNYVVAMVQGEESTMILDATDRLLPMGVLPERCLNGRGYIISKENPGWISLSAPKSKVGVSVDMEMNGEAKISGVLKIHHNGYAARSMRNQYFSKGEEEYVKNFQSGKPYQLANPAFMNLDKVHEQAVENYQFVWDENAGAPGTVFLNPLIYLRETENPFKLEDRKYPVDFGSPFERSYTLKFSIPDNYQVDELPESKIVMLPEGGGRFLYNANVIGNSISITSIFSIHKNLYTQVEYAGLREFFSLVVAKQAEQIVLKKK
jgi:hypothetical protein